MLSAGVDLAAQPTGTALAIIDWRSHEAELVELQLGTEDEPIVAAALRVEKIGIDCALGWPQEFVEFVSDYANPDAAHPDAEGGMDWRRRLAYRHTDRHVREVTGRWPLSVSTDRLGLTAMRCAGLMTRLSSAGVNTDRSGTGSVVEVYPAASLRRWGLTTQGYRNDPAARERLVGRLMRAAPWLHVSAFHNLMLSSADACDAVLAALSARAAWSGMSDGPPAHLVTLARSEGWIALPNGPLEGLLT